MHTYICIHTCKFMSLPFHCYSCKVYIFYFLLKSLSTLSSTDLFVISKQKYLSIDRHRTHYIDTLQTFERWKCCRYSKMTLLIDFWKIFDYYCNFTYFDLTTAKCINYCSIFLASVWNRDEIVNTIELFWCYLELI